jgi:trimeric autotransporter adhesin
MRPGAKMVRRFIIVSTLLVWASAGAAQTISVFPLLGLQFEADADSFTLGRPLIVDVIPFVAGDTVPFKFGAVVPVNPANNVPNFLVVSPSSGVAPAGLWVALNSNVVPYMPSGTYLVRLEFATAGQSCPPCAGILVWLRLKHSPAARISSVVNAATLQPGISPGAMVSILGSNLSTAPVTAQYDATGLYATDARKYQGSRTPDAVTFNGIAAPLLYISQSQINAVVPYSVAGQKTVDVVVRHDDLSSPAFSVPVADTSPGIFTTTQSGSGQGAILNSDGSVNSLDNPAPRGSIVQIFGTGAGVWNQTPQDGSVVLSALLLGGPPGQPLMRPLAPVSLSIGGQPAEIRYAGPAGNAVSGALQVNAVVPDNIGTGPQAVVLAVGDNNNVQQQATVAVR